MQQFLKFIFGIKLYMFRTVPLSIVTSFSLYTRVCWQFASRIRTEPRPDPARKLSANLCVPDDGERNCPKHVVLFQK